ncbi:hypothetical protein ACS5NO_12615 [Larkinella sp. GY13]
MSNVRIIEKDVFTRLHQHVQAHNAKQTKLRHHIRLGSLLTFEAVVVQYIKRFREASYLPEFPDSDILPSYYSSRKRLAELTKCCRKTIYNHLGLLADAGLVAKIWHGRQHDFELWINPWFILGDCYEEPVICDLSAQLPPPFHPDRRQSLPLKSSYDTSESHNSSKCGVEIGEKPGVPKLAELLPPFQRAVLNTLDTADTSERRDAHPTGDASETSENGGGARPGENSGHNPTEQNKAGKRLKSRLGLDDKAGQQAAGETEGIRPPQPAAAPLPAKPSLRDFYKELVVAFWDIVQPQLWPDDLIGDRHTGQILNIIWRDVFGSFASEPAENAATELYLMRLKQIEKATAHARRHRWTSFLPPKLYFSLPYYQEQKKNNQKGSFWFTYEWLQDDILKQQRLDKDRILEKALFSFIHERAPRGLKDGRQMGRIELYHYWRNRLSKLSDPGLVDRFDSAVAAALPGRPSATPFPKQPLNQR